MINLFDEEVEKDKTKSIKQKWRRNFLKYLEKEYEEKSDLKGRLCCGIDWKCDECYNKLENGCSDCYHTIIKILKNNFIDIDYQDYDFEKWEKKAFEVYRK